MEKPVAKTIQVLDYNECTEFLEEKYKINTRDYANSHSQFGEWCDTKGYGTTDPQGKDRFSSHIWYQEYQKDIANGLVVKRPYQDFWHFLLDRLDIRNGARINLDAEIGTGAEPWQQTILQLYLTEFGSGPYLVEW